MTKKKTATKKSAGPALIVFGPIGGKSRAGTFSEADAALAKKAAAELGLSVLEVDDKSKRDLAAKVGAGRVHANASDLLPVARKPVYEALTSLTNGDSQSNQEGRLSELGMDVASGPASRKPSEPRLPRSWEDISVGDMVLSQDTDPADGWWAAIVVKIQKEMISLRWQQRQSKKMFKKHKFNLALIWPGEDPNIGKVEAAGHPIKFPASWQAIDLNQLVLAKEDGPMEQWWEATPVEAVDDGFNLKWRDYPNVPAITRTRLGLALIHPAPGGSKGKVAR